MSWFADQIEQRRLSDEEAMEHALQAIADAASRQGSYGMFADSNQITANALESVLRYFRIPAPEVDLQVDDLNTRFELALRKSGVMHRPLTLRKDFYKTALGPLIVFEKDSDRAVALIPKGFGGYRYMDAQGKTHTVKAKDAERFKEEAYTFYKPYPQKKLDIKDFILYLLGCLSLSDLLAMGLVTLAGTLLGLFTPMITNILFSTVVDNKSIQLLLALGVFAVCLAASTALMGIASNLISERLSVKLSTSVEAATMMRLLSLPASFYKEHSSGEVASRAGQVGSLASSISSLVLSLGLTSVFSLTYVFQIWHYAPSLVVPAMVTIALQIIISFSMVKARNIHDSRRLESRAEMSAVTHGILSGIQKVKLSGAEKRFFSRWAVRYAHEASITYNPPLILQIGPVLSSGVVALGTIYMYGAAIANGVSVADYYAFTSAYAMVSGALLSLSSGVLAIAGIKATLKNVQPIFDAEPEYDPSKQPPKKLRGDIELKHVDFAYAKGGKQILKDFSISIPRGQYVAIVGRTGCGKSTLIRLLLGFETPQNGTVSFDGVDVNSIDMRFLRKQIGLVLQDGKLMRADIFSNIMISNPRITLEQAWEAAEKAQFADDIRAMPMGMNTLVGEGMGGLSGGQKQRLLIARAIAGDRNILIFDEATSALDNITQKKISDTLASMACTRIVVAHRLSTIKLCDRIIVLDDGKIAEDGTYDELIAQNGIFAELVERQRIEVN